MSKRLQVLLDEAELDAIQKTARLQQMTTAEWVRQVLRAARRSRAGGDVKKKLAAVRAGARNQFPTGSVDQMLAQIERGYLGGES